jgi:homoserine dehydrogenase
MKVKIAVVGLGNVGRSLMQMWGQLELWASGIGADIFLIAALDSSGGIFSQKGINPSIVLREKVSFNEISRSKLSKKIDAKYVIEKLHPDILIDLTPTNVKDGEPGFSNVLCALNQGVNVIVSSKNHLRSIKAMQKVEKLAEKKHAMFLDGASVMGGTPVFEMFDGINSEIIEVRAILNGSTNYILCKLQETGFQSALNDAIKRGYAEADYEYDVKGYDSALKVVGLCNRIFNKKIGRTDVRLFGIDKSHLGIEGIDQPLIQKLKNEGKTIKLVCKISEEAGSIKASVGPEILSKTDSLANIDSINNAIEIKGKANNSELNLFLAGPGSGGDVTASRVAGNLKKMLKELKRCENAKHKD